MTARGSNVYVAWSDVPPGADKQPSDIYLKPPQWILASALIQA